MKATSYTVRLNDHPVALVNYKEVIDFYRQPWYKRLFKSAPMKEFIYIDKKPC
jgi:hypothetical protein